MPVEGASYDMDNYKPVVEGIELVAQVNVNLREEG